MATREPVEDLVPDHVRSLSRYVPGKPAEELQRERGAIDPVKLASNENPIGPSPLAMEAARAALGGVNRYPDATHHALCEALAAHHKVTPSEILVGNGSNEIIDLLCRTLATDGDHVVFPDPSFVCYPLCAAAANLRSTAAPLRDHLHYDVDALLAAVEPGTRLLFVATPNNPTGAYLPEAELRRLLAGLPEHVTAVIDEAYAAFVDAADWVSADRLRGLHERTVVLRTFSKAQGLAGLRVGYAICGQSTVEYVHRVRAPFNVNAPAQAAAKAALADVGHLRSYVALNARERSRVASALAAMGLTVAPSQANFLLVDFGRPSAEVYEELLVHGVIVRPMAPPIGSWQRISIGLPFENDRMLEAVRRSV